MSIAIFLPTRRGSQRIHNKNTRPFANFQGGLLELKLSQLVKLDVDEIILSTNDERSIGIADAFTNRTKLKIFNRPAHLAENETKLTELIDYVPTLTNCEHILWTQVTSPFVDKKTYEISIKEYREKNKEGFDSLISVCSFKNFLWSKGEETIINKNKGGIWPHTQDLEELFEVNNAIFFSSREVYLKRKDRVGENPYLLELGKIQSLDIDWEEDFKIAEAVYEKFYQ